MKLKIWHKMIIGIAIPSFIAIMGGVLTYGYIGDVKNRQGFVLIADDLKEHVLEVRRNEKNFLHYKNEEYLEIFNSAILTLTNSVNNISQRTIKELGREEFSRLQKTIVSYSGLVGPLYENYLHEKTVTEQVRTEGRRLETFAKNGKHAEELSTNFILNLRRLEKNFMLFRDRKSFTELNNGLSQIKNIVPFCFECTPYVNAILDLSNNYKKSDSIATEIQISGEDMEKITGEIAGLERERIGSFLTLTQRLLLLALVLLCTLGPLFVYKTSNYIVKPINRLAEITRKISEGDTSLRAPIREHDETFSLASSFNTMVDNLQQTHDSLEKTVEILHEKQKEIEKRASLGFLISGVTHELNNPLNNISLTAETMKEDLEELTNEEQHEFLQDILTQSERAKHIIEDLLDFAGTRKSTVMEKLDIVNAVEESVNLVANELRINNIGLKLDIPDKALFVSGNRSKLEEVFINIMVNAIHAMKDRGTLTLSAHTDSQEKNIYIKIADTGSGIPEEHIKNIFEPFFTTKDVGEGTGLGLSVSQGIIKDHKGEILVQSNVGVGTTFTIWLPLYEEAISTESSV
jgi:signal transduction histidine kinase